MVEQALPQGRLVACEADARGVLPLQAEPGADFEGDQAPGVGGADEPGDVAGFSDVADGADGADHGVHVVGVGVVHDQVGAVDRAQFMQVVGPVTGQQVDGEALSGGGLGEAAQAELEPFEGDDVLLAGGVHCVGSQLSGFLGSKVRRPQSMTDQGKASWPRSSTVFGTSASMGSLTRGWA